MAYCKADVVSGVVTRIRDWRVVDLCPPPSSPVPHCTKCAVTGKKRAIRAALQHPVHPGVFACLAHARQEKFGFFPPPVNVGPTRTKKRKLRDEEQDDGGGSTEMDAIILSRSAVSKSALRSMTLEELRTLVQRHPGFGDDMESADREKTTLLKSKSAIVDVIAARMTALTWRRCCLSTSSSSSSSASSISVVAAGMRFAAIAQSTALFAEVDELVVENQLGFVAARMKSMQDVVSCMAVFAGVPVVRAVSAATKLRNLETPETLADNTKVQEEEKLEEHKEHEEEAGREYRSRKSQGIAQCRAWMTSNPSVSADWTGAFENTKKKDDMADALLQLLGQIGLSR